MKSTVGNWQRAFKLLFKLAEVPTGHAHRFRDTFAVELLLAGIPLERVSILLGHQSTRITEKHYAPWVRERQEQIEEDVRRMWEGEKRGHAFTHTAQSRKISPLFATLRMVEAGGVGIFCLLKTHNLLILRDAQNARSAEIAPNWNVSGTRAFQNIDDLSTIQ